MQATQRLHASRHVPLLRTRFVRRLRVVLVRFLRRSLREESPILERMAPDVEDRSGFGPITLR